MNIPALTVLQARSDDGTRLHVDVAGSGEPLIVVHGSGVDRRAVSELQRELSAHHTVAVYDRRGRGASGDTPPYKVHKEVQDLAAVQHELRRLIGTTPVPDGAGGEAADDVGAGPVATAGVDAGVDTGVDDVVEVVGVSSGGALVLRAAAAGVITGACVLWEPPLGSADVADDRENPPDDPTHANSYSPTDNADDADGVDNGASTGGAGAGPPTAAEGRGLAGRGPAERMEALLARGRREDVVAVFATSMVRLPPAAVDAMVGTTTWEQLVELAHTLPYDARVTGSAAELTALARRVPNEVTVLDGASVPWTTRAADALAAALPHGRRATLAGQPHDVAAPALAAAVRFHLTRAPSHRACPDRVLHPSAARGPGARGPGARGPDAPGEPDPEENP